MPGEYTGMFAVRLNSICAFPVREAKNGDRVVPGIGLVAPGGYQLKVTRSPDGLGISIAPGEKVSGHCPSVDVLFSSVAACAGANAVGAILTGMGSDGAKGLLLMRQAGADTIGQDKGTCVVYGMPKAAYENGAVECELPIDQIASRIVSLL
jgi:two-component system chemotaxis response regulator CheB